MKNISILGATGSIGTQTLDVIRNDPENFNLIGVSANKNSAKIIDIIKEFNPKYAALVDNKAYNEVKEYCMLNNIKTKVIYGIEGLNYIAEEETADTLVTSVVGIVGVIPTLKGIKSGKKIALANKETLVVAGEIVMREAEKNNVSIVPVDSEHCAIYQCLQGNSRDDIDKILLTASGGPFRGRKQDTLKDVTVEQALNHPRWHMGKKISIDSATLMNKGLEVIEAHWLFNTEFKDIKVIVHPQSIIHSMVQYVDGSVIAQMGSTDMRLPIQYALNYPIRKERIVEKLDFNKFSTLTFEEPDMITFKSLALAYEAGKAGGLMPTILNGANEEAVSLFMERKINFLDIANIVEKCLCKFINNKDITVENIIETDRNVKEYVRGLCK
ncbi:1-deoxy-D-xylulose-5-phosphate reductoisomerase [Clostridium sp. JN-9]|uniref:1-deoxy-D-xylulose-5-phosphate reductoisomerase n=1 Tax=Clostridium sp. JN-9 TaxID=2507159 RepID=UPI000FFE14E6|nr:1-deoxy-D-xylulose-5-phosphate reductoisomerase [Clostridium sp. JN-9]QAT40197.1 1-deoxy-D-xylulose-5-phosphate reductoisomerase [Clostridium sp. JN-9]